MTMHAKTAEELAQIVLNRLDLGDELGEGAPKTANDLSNSIRSGWIDGDAVMSMIRDAVHLDRELPAATEVFVIQDEGGDVIDVTTSREWAEWQTRDDADNPYRTLHEDTLWDGPEDRAEWGDDATGAYGIKRVPINSAGAIVCGACGRAWAEDITPAGRCPWEDRHDDEGDYEDSSRECSACGDEVATLSTDDLCDGCVSQH